MRKLTTNNQASAVPLILFFLAIFVCGALYTLFMIEIGLPIFEPYVPTSDSKTFILMLIYAMPLIVLIIGIISLLLAGLKREVIYP